MSAPNGRSDEERERARLERERRRAEREEGQAAPAAPAPPATVPPSSQRADRVMAAERPHVKERVQSALARSARRPKREAVLDSGPLGAKSQDGSGEPPPATGRRRRRRLGPVALLMLLAVAAVIWFAASLYQPGKSAGATKTTVTIPRGGSLNQIAHELGSAGVVSSEFFFKLRARIGGHTSDLKPGVYVLHKDMPYSDVLDKLTAGPPRHIITVTIPEGRARSEIAPIVKAAGVLGSYTGASARSRLLNPHRYGAARGATLEGFLFPATYQLKRGATARTLVARQIRAFKQNIAKVPMSYARKKNLTVFDVVTIASMVEREAQLPSERALIASVIYNRLKQGIPLGIDATIRYATGNWTRPLRVSELHISSGYNTRTHQGLPPGPIGNPGLASLKAAAHPARTHYLFYVVKPGTCGKHSFSSTDAQFQRDVAKYNSARAKKGGKSPTTCH